MWSDCLLDLGTDFLVGNRRLSNVICMFQSLFLSCGPEVTLSDWRGDKIQELILK